VPVESKSAAIVFNGTHSGSLVHSPVRHCSIPNIFQFSRSSVFSKPTRYSFLSDDISLLIAFRLDRSCSYVLLLSKDKRGRGRGGLSARADEMEKVKKILAWTPVGKRPISTSCKVVRIFDRIRVAENEGYCGCRTDKTNFRCHKLLEYWSAEQHLGALVSSQIWPVINWIYLISAVFVSLHISNV
jgi:hypothetical protein